MLKSSKITVSSVIVSRFRYHITSSIKDAFWARPCLIIAKGLINLRQDKSSSLIPGFVFIKCSIHGWKTLKL